MDVNRNLDFLKLMNSYSSNVGSCSCLVNGSVEDFLHCAPCPPPTMTYKEFRDHARNQTLETKDICIISKRCFGNSTALTVDCPPFLFVCPETSTIDKVPTTKPPPSDVLKTAGIIVGIVILIACVIGCLWRKWQDIKCPSKLTCFEKHDEKEKRKEIISISKTETPEQTPESSPKTSLLEYSNIFSETNIIDLQPMKVTYIHEKEYVEEQIPESKNESEENPEAILGESARNLESLEIDSEKNASEGDNNEHRNDHTESLTDDTHEDDQAVFENKSEERFEIVNESVEENSTISPQLISKESGQPLESSNSDLEYELSPEYYGCLIL